MGEYLIFYVTFDVGWLFSFWSEVSRKNEKKPRGLRHMLFFHPNYIFYTYSCGPLILTNHNNFGQCDCSWPTLFFSPEYCMFKSRNTISTSFTQTWITMYLKIQPIIIHIGVDRSDSMFLVLNIWYKSSVPTPTIGVQSKHDPYWGPYFGWFILIYPNRIF